MTATPPRARWAPLPASRKRLGALCVAAALGLCVGLLGLGNAFEEVARELRGALQPRAASGKIVVVAIDDRTLAWARQSPLPRDDLAAIVNQTRLSGASKLAVDLDLTAPTNASSDRKLARALTAWGHHVYLPDQVRADPDSGSLREARPLAAFASAATLVYAAASYSFRNSVSWLPYGSNLPRGRIPSMSAALAGNVGGADGYYPIDLSIRARTVPTISALDILQGRVTDRLKSKLVIIGSTAEQAGNIYFLPGQGLRSAPYFQALGVETLLRGSPVDLGWFPAFALTVALSALSLLLRRRLAAIGAGVVAISLIATPFWLDRHLILVEIMPALFVPLLLAPTILWQELRRRYREKASINADSGLPILAALREAGPLQPHALVAARIINYAEVIATLTAGLEPVLIRQIAARLTLGHADLKLHQGDEGIFAWIAGADDRDAITGHLEALHSIFRAPVPVGDRTVDLKLSFGVDDDASRPIVARLGSALVAADEAAEKGTKWAIYDPSRLQEATWRLSLLSQLDAAIDGGDLWVAYQPKLDLASGQIVGAEALVRWTHRDKGPISPEEFVRAAEQSDRIEKLTVHVLDRAIEAGAAINAQGIPFEIAVNISAKLIDDPALVTTVATLLAKHGLDDHRLVLEVTETAAMATTDASLDTLSRLRTLGLQLSIDDYGTGLSTLDYLRRIPASEIKIDKCFVQPMDTNRGDRLLVESTIQLAHSLGRRVVAEGVERAETLELLTLIGCDLAQGYHIGRPMTLRALCERLAAERGVEAA